MHRALAPFMLLAAACGNPSGGLLAPPELQTTFTLKNALSTPLFVRVESNGDAWAIVRGTDGTALYRKRNACSTLCGDPSPGVPCEAIVPAPFIARIEPGTSRSDVWSGLYYETGDHGCLKEKLVDSQPLTLSICYARETTADGRDLVQEACDPFIFRPGIDRELVDEVKGPAQRTIDFVLENHTSAKIFVQATAQCTAEQGWVSATNAQSEHVYPTHADCGLCRCGAESCPICEVACVEPSIDEVAPGDTARVSWDGYYLEFHATGGPNGFSCQEPRQVVDGSFTAHFCWSATGATSNPGQLSDLTCRDQTFTFGQVTAVHVAAE